MCIADYLPCITVWQPDFSSTPLNTDAAVDEWLQFYEMEAPLVCVGELISHDPVNVYLSSLVFFLSTIVMSLVYV